MLSCVQLFVTLWTAACQASLSITNSRSLLKSCPSSRWCYLTISSSVVNILLFMPALYQALWSGSLWNSPGCFRVLGWGCRDPVNRSLLCRAELQCEFQSLCTSCCTSNPAWSWGLPSVGLFLGLDTTTAFLFWHTSPPMTSGLPLRNLRFSSFLIIGRK